MNKIKVFLNTGDHPIYFSLVKFSPQNIELVNKPQKENSSLFRIYSKRKNLMRIGLTKISSFLRIPRMFYFKTNADLIHTSRGIIPLNKKPWVMDIEHAKSFFDSHKVLYSERARKVVKKFIFSEHCKKIMPHCYMAKKSLTYHFGKQLDKKICVLYPAIEKRKYKARQDVKTVRILFIANKFFEKGGLEVLQTFKLLEKKYDIQLIFKCKAPEQYKRNFLSDNIIFLEKNFSYEEVFSKIYANSNIFIFPSYIDTFGFALLEAMSVGLPIVTTNIFALPEIVEDGINGFLIDARKYDWANEYGVMKIKWLLTPEDRMKLYPKEKPEIVRQLAEKLSLLVENYSLRKRMGREGRRLVEKGKFSIAERNKKLKAIYEEALRS